MNKLEMGAYISEQVPHLAKLHKTMLKEAERLRKQFVLDYPIDKISKLLLDEYVIGKGGTYKSFCYRLEQELDSLGEIIGATANKFGVYYGRIKSDATKKYRFAMHWGDNQDEVFNAVKQSIVELLKAASKDDIEAIRNNKISPMFKGKLLFIYYPEKFAPIYAKPHLEHFLVNLNINWAFNKETDMQRALMDYRAEWPELMRHHVCLYMRFLYNLFGYPNYSVSSYGVPSSISVPLLNDAIKGATFINEMPAISGTTPPHAGADAVDYDRRHKQWKRIGDRGEHIVLALEKQRLTNLNRNDLAERVDYVAELNDGAGYDILSFDEDGTKRPIEVKATSGMTLDRGFYITANEVEQSSNLGNYHIYFVFSAMSKKPQVLPVKEPTLSGGDFDLKPITYRVTLNARAVNAKN